MKKCKKLVSSFLAWTLKKRVASSQSFRILSLVAAVLLVESCAIDKMAVQMISDMMGSGSSTVFTGEEDPELVGEALPFAIKLYESLIEVAPDNPGLLLTTGQAFVLYAYAYVQTPAEMLPEYEFEARVSGLLRAKKLYLRGRRYILDALDLKHPGLKAALLSEQWDGDLQFTTPEDIPYMYWAGMAWLGALTTDFFDMELLVTLQRGVALMSRVLELDETYDSGAVHEFFVSYYGGVSKEMGGSEEKARLHFKRALELSDGKKASTYLALATTVCVSNQDVAEFCNLLESALAIDLDAAPNFRLMNVLAQRRAAWLLEHIDNYFLILEE